MITTFLRKRRSTTLSATLVFVALANAASAQRSPDTRPPSISNRVSIDTKRPIDFHAAVWPETVYVNQQVNYQVGEFLIERAR
jgi:hypothetical protein